MWAEYIDERTIRPAPRNGFDISNLPLWFDKYPDFATEKGYHRIVESGSVAESTEGYHAENRYALADDVIYCTQINVQDEEIGADPAEMQQALEILGVNTNG